MPEAAVTRCLRLPITVLAKEFANVGRSVGGCPVFYLQYTNTYFPSVFTFPAEVLQLLSKLRHYIYRS